MLTESIYSTKCVGRHIIINTEDDDDVGLHVLGCEAEFTAELLLCVPVFDGCCNVFRYMIVVETV